MVLRFDERLVGSRFFKAFADGNMILPKTSSGLFAFFGHF